MRKYNSQLMSGEGATVYCLGPGADDKDSHLVNSLFSSVGLCRRVEESQIGERLGASTWC